ncbi:MAG: hypothetical protein ACRC4L_00875 [Mycoplasma sp.]
MPQYLIILLSIMAGAFILLALYGIWVLRRFSIVGKKIDYLVEDITYKSEMLSPLVDSLLKFSSYIDVIEVIISKNTSTIKEVVNNNKSNITKFKNQLEKVLDEK